MKTLSYSSALASLAEAMDQVNKDHVPILITRQKGGAAVLLSLEDFESWRESAYLTRGPAMVRRLRRAITQIESGKAKIRKLIK